MPPARGDHEARRLDVSETVWRVLSEHGFGGLTLRAVAAGMDSSTGLLTHYFPAKRDLVAYALDVLDERTQHPALLAGAAPGMAALRSVLLGVLPLTEQGIALNRVWVSSWDVALADAELGRKQAARYARSRADIRERIDQARDLGELPADTDAEGLAAEAMAFAHGLVVQALFDPARFTPTYQVRLLDAYLEGMAQR